MALLLARVIERKARSLGHRESLSAILDRLAEIRLSMLLLPSGEKGGRPRAQWQLEIAEDETYQLFKHLVPQSKPFVYTH